MAETENCSANSIPLTPSLNVVIVPIQRPVPGPAPAARPARAITETVLVGMHFLTGTFLKVKFMVQTRFHDDLSLVDPEALQKLYLRAGFEFPHFKDNLGEHALRRFFPQSGFGFFAQSDESLIGAARVFSDDLTVAWISEICVREDLRRQSIGSTLLGMINGRFGHLPLLTTAHRDMKGFFQKKGLTPRKKLFACGRAPL